MKVRDQIKLKFQSLGVYLEEMVEISKTLPTKEHQDVFMEIINNEIRNEIAVACNKIKREVNSELENAIIEKMKIEKPIEQSEQNEENKELE